MKTSYILTGIAAASLGVAGLSAPAAAATQITGVGSLDLNQSDPGLVLWYTAHAFDFSLTDTYVAPVFTIGTNEEAFNLFDDNWNLDDGVEFPITATFSFSSPAGASGPAITGTTHGSVWFFGDCQNNLECGRVEWDGPAIFDFGNGGQFKLKLTNAEFDLDGQSSKVVNGKFTLLAPSVPEPSTWALMILGFGAVGLMMRSSRRQNVKVSYA